MNKVVAWGIGLVLGMSALSVNAAQIDHIGSILVLQTSDEYENKVGFVQMSGITDFNGCTKGDLGHGSAPLWAFKADEHGMLSMLITAFSMGVQVEVTLSSDYTVNGMCRLRAVRFK